MRHNTVEGSKSAWKAGAKMLLALVFCNYCNHFKVGCNMHDDLFENDTGRLGWGVGKGSWHSLRNKVVDKK